jgi:hypothetical protein
MVSTSAIYALGDFPNKEKRGVADSDRHSSRLPSDRQNHVRIDEAIF